ncbi:hypothetical protein C7N43_23760 [Sphingobacteriales bacterium UPWRP_1]|nr:hypothetical protein BVG80_06725 [Sphingobacteriales bacterium TSM_CSM]PSJ74507.1 hypothetical protein C7N43_23760 [Sphingobacteriales bacterium UPWRP_1]
MLKNRPNTLFFVPFACIKKTCRMPYANLTPVFTPAQLQLALQLISDCRTQLPFLVNLTPQERTGYLRLGPNAAAFFNKAINHCQNNPHLMPPFMALAEWQNDHEVYKHLEVLLAQVRVLEQAIADTVIALRQENTVAAMSFYKMVKMAATQNVPGTDAILADLQPMLPGIKANRKAKNKQVGQGEE